MSGKSEFYYQNSCLCSLSAFFLPLWLYTIYAYPKVHNMISFILPFGWKFAAIATVVTIAEILKNNGLAVEKSGSPHPLLFFFRFLAFSLLPNRWLKLLQRSRLPLWKSKMNQEGGPCRRPRSSPNLPLWILSFVYFSTYLAGSNRFVLWGCFLSINKSRSRFCWGRRRTSTSWWPRRRRRGKLERARSRAEELWGALRDLFSVSPCSLQFFPPFFNWWYFY